MKPIYQILLFASVCSLIVACSSEPAEIGELPTVAVLDAASETDENENTATDVIEMTEDASITEEAMMTEAVTSEPAASEVEDLATIDISATNPVTLVGEFTITVTDRTGGSNLQATIPQAEGWTTDGTTLTNGATDVTLSVIGGTGGEAPMNVISAAYDGAAEIQSEFSLDYSTTLIYAYDPEIGLVMVFNTIGSEFFEPLIVEATGTTDAIQAALGAIVEMTKSVELVPPA